MRVRMGLVMATFGAMLAVAGCGGDNLDLCDGCGSPTPTPSITPTPGTPTATPPSPSTSTSVSSQAVPDIMETPVAPDAA